MNTQQPNNKQDVNLNCKNPIYCEACGDCLNCYGEDWCYGSDDGEHTWPTPAADVSVPEFTAWA